MRSYGIELLQYFSCILIFALSLSLAELRVAAKFSRIRKAPKSSRKNSAGISASS
jgi:hypothetical protein